MHHPWVFSNFAATLTLIILVECVPAAEIAARRIDADFGVAWESTTYSGNLIFSAFSGDGWTLHRTDGSTVETLANSASTGFTHADGFTPATSGLYFIGRTGPNSAEVARFDGTTLTSLPAVPPVGTQFTPLDKRGDSFAVLDEAVFFFGTGPSGRELYRIDGEQVSIVDDLNPDGDSFPEPPREYGYPSTFTVYSGNLIFSAFDSTSEIGLYLTDGMAISRLDVHGDASTSFVEVNDLLMFVTNQRLYSFDGERVSLLSNETRSPVVEFSGNGFFSTREGFYRTDGKRVTLIDNTVPRIDDFAVFGNELFMLSSVFDQDLSSSSVELYKTDGENVTLVGSVDDTYGWFQGSVSDQLVFQSTSAVYTTNGNVIEPFHDGAFQNVEVLAAFGDKLLLSNWPELYLADHETIEAVKDLVTADSLQAADNFVPFPDPTLIGGRLVFPASSGGEFNAADLLYTLTLVGDANEDGGVEFADFLLLSQNFGQPGGWPQGDFDLSGTVNFADFLALASNFGESIVGEGASFSVPEPSGFFPIGIGFATLFFRKQRVSGLRTARWSSPSSDNLLNGVVAR